MTLYVFSVCVSEIIYRAQKYTFFDRKPTILLHELRNLDEKHYFCAAENIKTT